MTKTFGDLSQSLTMIKYLARVSALTTPIVVVVFLVLMGGGYYWYSNIHKVETAITSDTGERGTGMTTQQIVDWHHKASRSSNIKSSGLERGGLEQEHANKTASTTAGELSAESSQKSNTNSVPVWIIEQGNQYLIERLGKRYFEENFALDEKSTKYRAEYGPEGGWYRVVYTHLTFTELLSESGRRSFVMVDIDINGNNVSQAVNGTIPNCRVNTKLCQIRIDKEAAISIARANGLNLESKVSFSIKPAVIQEDVKEGWEWIFYDLASVKGQACSVAINISSGDIRVGEGPCPIISDF